MLEPFESRIPIPLSEVRGQRTDDGDLILKPNATLSIDSGTREPERYCVAPAANWRSRS